MSAEDVTKKAQDGSKDATNPAVVPLTSGHKAIVEVNFTYRAEADPNSESVKNFLKAVGEFSQGRTTQPTQGTTEPAKATTESGKNK